MQQIALSFVPDEYLLMSIINRAKPDCPSIFFHPAYLLSVLYLQALPISKRLMAFHCATAWKRCEADVNPCQIQSYCGACIVCGWLKKAEKEACHAVLYAGVSVAGCKLCPLAGMWCGRELDRERPFSEVTCCNNSHMLTAGRKTMLPFTATV